MALTDYVLMPGSDYQAVCDAIRDKTGKSDVIKSGDMAAEIGSIVTRNTIIRKTGTYIPISENGIIEIEHNLGALPDLIMIESNQSSDGNLHDVIGYADEIAQVWSCQRAHVYDVEQITTCDIDSSIFVEDASVGYISSATPTKFCVGGSLIKHDTTATYTWTAISGLINHIGYFFMRVELDGNGHLIITDGVPEVQQLNIYVDGVLAKTVDYIHDDEVIVDISDIAPDVRIYTISVSGVGENLDTLYPYAFYDTVTGYANHLESNTCGSTTYWIVEDETLTVYGRGSMNSYYNQQRPYEQDVSTIRQIVIEGSVTDIGNYAFQQCENVTSVIIHNGVTRIGHMSFQDCTNLTSVTIPDSVTSIGDNAFNGCTGLTSVTIPNSVTSIGEGVFKNCSSLTYVTFSNGLTEIGDMMFSGCTSLANIAIPDTVTSFGYSAFYGCTNLANVNIPNGVYYIPYCAFYLCENLTNITIPDNVTSIGKSAFGRCTRLTSIVMSQNITSIGDTAFQMCPITSITIPTNVTSIGKQAFDSTSLTSATFEVTSGWSVRSSETATSGTSLNSSSLANTSTAANYLKQSYRNYYWRRS